MRGRRGFKPSLRDMMLASQRAQEFMALGAPPEKQAAAREFLDRAAAAIPAAPKKRTPRMDGVDIDAIHGSARTSTLPLEAEVIRAVGQLLAVHPKVLYALRMNSGAAFYDAGNGRYAPVWFHKWVRYPEKCRMSDYFGAVVSAAQASTRILAIDCKRVGWTKPTDEREREQAAFLAIVRRAGGIGIFATSANQVAAALAGA